MGISWATDRTKLLFEFASWLCKVQVTQSTQSFRGAEADSGWFYMISENPKQDDTRIWQATWWLKCETWLTQVSRKMFCCICHPVKKKVPDFPLSSTTQGPLQQSVPKGRVYPFWWSNSHPPKVRWRDVIHSWSDIKTWTWNTSKISNTNTTLATARNRTWVN